MQMAELNNTIINKIVEITKPLYSQILLALIIALLGLILGTIIGKLLQKVLSEIELNRMVRSVTGLNMKLEEIIGKGITFIIYFLFIMWALEKLGLGAIIIKILSWIVIIVIVISIVLSIKDFLPNLISGIYIHLKGVIKENDYIRTKSVTGIIKDIGLVETIFETDSKETVVIPNSTLLKEIVIKPKKKKATRAGGN
jgi:small conductance mechanosensitive channel